MMNVTVTATVQYTCFLDDADACRVNEYAKQNECTLEEAVWALYTDDTLNLYDNSTESDFTTESIDQVEEECELWGE